VNDELALRRDMGCTLEEFLRWLPGATRNAPMQVGTDRATVRTGGGTVEITYAQGRPRTIGPISIPVLDVSFRFVGLEPASRAEFLAYFDMYTRRGGG
jgi:hypothetical protein